MLWPISKGTWRWKEEPKEELKDVSERGEGGWKEGYINEFK